MNKKIINSKISYLGKLFINFNRSEIAYKNYLKEGGVFLHARILKECNEFLRHLLIENSYLMGEELRNAALDLICHYDIWITKWNDLYDKTKPKLDDVFVFENNHVFPKEAEQKFKEEFIRLKKS